MASYSSQTASGYNSSPPPDDGSTGSDNQITWAKIKTKLTDPLKTLAEGINSAISTTITNLGSMADQNSTAVSITGGNITGITTMTATSLTASSLTATTASITAGSITGITDLAVADGGTGASSASDARTNLGLGTISTQASSNVSITGGSITGVTFSGLTLSGTNTIATANITTGNITTADINGGAIDGTTIGSSSPSTGVFTTCNATTAGTAGTFTTTTNTGDAFYALAQNGSFTGTAFRAGCTRSNDASYNLCEFRSNVNGSEDVEFRCTGVGVVTADGTITGGGADYAEMFEWANGLGYEDDVAGHTVVLVGDKIELAKKGSDPIGVISARPAHLGNDSPMGWHKRYLTDEFGRYLRDEKGERILNPDTDMKQWENYVPRSQRKEWAPVGLVGRLRIRKGQPVSSRWIKLREFETVDEYLVR